METFRAHSEHIAIAILNRQILKDLDMLHDLAKGLKSPTPMSSQTASLFRILNSKGHEELDGMAILNLYDQNDTI